MVLFAPEPSKEGFDRPKESVTYVPTAEVVSVADDQNLAAEQGRWVATLPSGSIAHTGTYAAMWWRTMAGWKIRSEIFVTLHGEPLRPLAPVENLPTGAESVALLPI